MKIKITDQNVENFEEELFHGAGVDIPYGVSRKYLENFLERIYEQQLANIKADAIEEAVSETRLISQSWVVCDAQELMEYARQLRDG